MRIIILSLTFQMSESVSKSSASCLDVPDPFPQDAILVTGFICSCCLVSIVLQACRTSCLSSVRCGAEKKPC